MNKHDIIYKNLYAKGLRGKELEEAYRRKHKLLLESLDEIVDKTDDAEIVESCKQGKCRPSTDFK